MADKFAKRASFPKGLNVQHSNDNVTATPTDAEFDAAFGTPAEVGAGFVGTLDDAGGDTTVYIVASNGTSWFYAALTKAL